MIKFGISQCGEGGGQDVRKVINDNPIHHLQVGSLEDWWFLTHLLEVVSGLEVPHFKFQVSRISGT